jgi:dTMP kinase
MINGRLIAFEGLDGSGKTTQMDLLGHWFESHNISYVRTREPGGTPLGQEIRQILLNRPDLGITPLAEAFLFQADRAQHFATLVLPALANGKVVITDRCIDSSIAYQGGARGLGMERIEQLSLLATQKYVPDLTILLDLDPINVHVRTDISQDVTGYREQQNRFDKESEQFHRRLRDAFLALARTYPERIKVIDASQSLEQIHQEIVALVSQLLL